MYITVREPRGAKRERPPERRSRRLRGVSGPVLLLGITSLVTDLSSEMVAAVLPLFLTLQLGASPLQFGVIDGLYQGVTAVVRLGAGWVADRWRRAKAVAVGGYLLSALMKPLLLVATTLPALGAVVAVDRLGKGIRTGPRDALIAANSHPDRLGLSFGVHRALDTVGATGGPLLAFALLTAVPGAYDAVFVTSFFLALVGVAVLALFVPEQRRATGPPSPERPPEGPAEHTVTPGELRRVLTSPGLRRTLLAAALLTVATVSDGFIYLSLLRRGDIDADWFPLLFVGTSLAYLLLAVPLGHLADRVGRRRVFLAGHVALLAVYLLLQRGGSGLVVAVACLALLGTYYAATDGVLAALAVPLLPETLRSSGLAALQTVIALGRFAGSVAFGALWTLVGRNEAFAVTTVLLVVALPVAALALRRGRVPAEAAA